MHFHAGWSTIVTIGFIVSQLRSKYVLIQLKDEIVEYGNQGNVVNTTLKRIQSMPESRDDTEHYFNDDEEPVTGNEPPTGCVYETTGGIPCQPEFTYSGKKYGQWHGSCAPGSWPSGPWCYDIRGGGYWDRCKVDSDSNPTCSGTCWNDPVNNLCENFSPRNCVDDRNRLNDCRINCGLCKTS